MDATKIRRNDNIWWRLVNFKMIHLVEVGKFQPGFKITDYDLTVMIFRDVTAMMFGSK